MATRVFYSGWQLQCCGDGFAIGDTVSWTAVPADAQLLSELGPVEGADISWREEHHPRKSQRLTTIDGTVTAIRVIREGIGEDALRADGTAATGYVVTLS